MMALVGLVWLEVELLNVLLEKFLLVQLAQHYLNTAAVKGSTDMSRSALAKTQASARLPNLRLQQSINQVDRYVADLFEMELEFG
jgi:hypothetical protein